MITGPWHGSLPSQPTFSTAPVHHIVIGLDMESVCVLFEFRIHKLAGEWRVWCGFPLKSFKTKREAVSWCKRAAKSFHDGRKAATINDDGTPNLTPEYEVAVSLKQLLIACE